MKYHATTIVAAVLLFFGGAFGQEEGAAGGPMYYTGVYDDDYSNDRWYDSYDAPREEGFWDFKR